MVWEALGMTRDATGMPRDVPWMPNERTPIYLVVQKILKNYFKISFDIRFSHWGAENSENYCKISFDNRLLHWGAESSQTLFQNII